MFMFKIRRPSGLIWYQHSFKRTCTNSVQPTAGDRNSTQPSADDEKERELERIAKDASIDSPPTACCQSGCSNCVFIVWAEALSAKMQNAGPEITDKILKSVEDPSMKAYLEMELRLRGLKK